MACVQDLWYEQNLQLLICKAHGFGLHPTPQAITRHLRGDGHNCRGKMLKLTVTALIKLPLRAVDELLEQVPSVEEQPISPPIPHLRVLSGWKCIKCDGRYLTTSIELVQRHAGKTHSRHRGDAPLWESCELQTFFQETKDRRYFRVTQSQSSASRGGRGTGICDAAKELTRKRASAAGRGRTNCCPASSRHLTTPRCALNLVHPFARLAERHMSSFSIDYLDGLFKSASFRAASEPLFDPSHVDSTTNMQRVFPTCDDEPLFYHALVYAMIKSSSGGDATAESFMLEKTIVDLLNHQLGITVDVSEATVGAIMLLKTTAYKLEDESTHAIHSQGLKAALTSCGRERMNGSARRAYFWQDVYAAVFLDCDLAAEPNEIFENVKWAREMCADNALPDLPAGFLRHSSVIPQGLLDVVIDLLEMKRYLPVLAQLPLHMRYQHLDSMQASMESRLVQQSRDSRAIGPITEAVRLAVFLCCYCAWMEIWNDHFVPCKLAERLLSVLEATISTDEQFVSIWSGRVDLLLWLAFVCSNVIHLDDGRIRHLRSRRKQLLGTIAGTFCRHKTPDAALALNSVLTDFIYCEWWSTDKTQILDWEQM